MDGFEVLRRLRASGAKMPVLVLTARDDEVDKVIGLELGADDYLTKPFNPRELVARVKAILRRGTQSQRTESAPIRLGALSIDEGRREARVGDTLLDLRAKEFDLLTVMAQQPGRVFTREQLLRDAWGFDYYGQTRTVDVHVGQLRRKLGGSAVTIETITGIGYKLVG
jgi:DNA-binding response OmpR family regulator